MKKLIFLILLILFTPILVLSDSEIINGEKKAQPHDGFSVDGNVSFEESIAVGEPVSIEEVDYPLSFYRLDSNNIVIGGVSINVSDLTDGSQVSSMGFHTITGGVLRKTTQIGGVSLADGSERDLNTDGRSGFFRVISGNGSEYACGYFDTFANVTLTGDSSANTSSTQNDDGNLIIYDAGTSIAIDNELNSTLDFLYEVMMSP